MENKRWTKISVYCSQKLISEKELDGSSLIQFTRESVDAGFIFNKDDGFFMLSDWEKVEKFASEKLSFWEDSFDINYLGESALIRGGTNELNWEIEAKSRATESMLLVDRFRLGQKKLSKKFTHRISKLGIGTMFLPKKGLIRLNRSQVDDFAWWRQNRGKHSDTEWPRYMLFFTLCQKTPAYKT